MSKKVEIKSKIWKTGSGYVISIPKALVDTKVFDIGEHVTAQISLDEKALIGVESRDLLNHLNAEGISII